MEKVKVRINNSHKHIWAVVWNGQPEDFSDAKDITLIASVRDKRINLTQGIDYVIEGNLVKIDFTPRFCNNTGVYNIELNYTKPSEGFLSGERRTAVDLNVIEIVGTSACADATDETSSVSEAAFGFQGLSAYEVWLKDNPGKTKEDYFNWLQKPATDIAETVSLQEQARVDAEIVREQQEQDRQINTAIAIDNANNAKGWTPLTTFEEYNGKQIKKLVGYIGGTGAEPTDNVGEYFTENGFTNNKDLAVNFRGTDGVDGDSIVNINPSSTMQQVRIWVGTRNEYDTQKPLPNDVITFIL